MATTGEKIKHRLKTIGRRPAWLAEEVNISRTAIGKVINDETDHSKYLFAIARILGLKYSYLIDDNCSIEEQELVTVKNGTDDAIQAIDAWDSATPLHSDDVELPLFREVELSAGSGRTEVIENHGAKLRFAKSSLAKQGVSPDSAACCFVSGDSMEPVLPDGSTVGIDTAQTTIADGKMYAIDYAGMLRVKLLYRVPGGIKIRSINREYDDEIVTDENLDTLRIIGKVFWSASFHN